MPPKAKFTKAEIIGAALNIVRTDGYEALTSRALGTYLGSSARPIFTVFKNMEEVQQAMIEAAKQNCGKDTIRSASTCFLFPVGSSAKRIGG